MAPAPAAVAEQTDAIEMLVGHEADIESMYCDTCQPPVVTVAVGHALFHASDAMSLPFFWKPNIHGIAVPANPQEIEAAFYRTVALKITAAKLRLATLFLKPETRRTLLMTDIMSKQRTLQHEIPDYWSLPRPAQLALLDIAFECGSLADFPKLRAAVAAGDWSAAAKESFRPQAGAERNENTAKRFLGLIEAK